MRSVGEKGRGGRIAVSVALLAGMLASAGIGLAQDKPKSLYQRIGGYDTIAGVVDDFLQRLQADPAFQRFGQGRGQNSLMRARQLVVDQICNLSGGPCTYIGRDMKTAHGGLAITAAEFEAAGKHMTASLQKFKLAPAEQQDFMAMIGKLQADIVEKPAAPAAAPAPKS